MHSFVHLFYYSFGHPPPQRRRCARSSAAAAQQAASRRRAAAQRRAAAKRLLRIRRHRPRYAGLSLRISDETCVCACACACVCVCVCFGERGGEGRGAVVAVCPDSDRAPHLSATVANVSPRSGQQLQTQWTPPRRPRRTRMPRISKR